jgi:hypothetical protein
MPTRDENLPPLTFAHLLLIALEETKVSRTEMTKACGVLPRTVARWVDGDAEPDIGKKSIVIHLLHDSGRLRKVLLDKLCENIGLEAWQLNLEPPPVPEFIRSPATEKVLDDAVREAAEELGVDPRVLRPVLSRLFAALVRYEIPAGAAAEMVVARMKR